MSDEPSPIQDRARRGYVVIDRADLVDVTSYDSFPASDPPAWIATGIGSPQVEELSNPVATRAPPVAAEAGSGMDDLVAPGAPSALEQKNLEEHMHTTSPVRIPESIQAEHGAIHEELVRATRESGPIGVAARELAAVLHAHFVREEEIALPPLGLLAPLSRGEFTSEMRDVLPLSDSLREELPRMLEEHKAIKAATSRLGDVARAEGNTAVARLAEQLRLHAQSEEELFYPAALLVGDLVRSRMP